MTKWLAIAALFAATACGFRPLHSEAERTRFAVQLESVEIATGNSPAAQLLKAEIQDQVNPVAQRAEKLFTLHIEFAESEVALFINPDGTSGRGDYHFNSAYTLSRRFDGKVVDSGQLNRISSFSNAQTADFSTFISREDARKRGIKELAQDYKLRLANLLPKLNDPDAKPGEIMTPHIERKEIILRDRMNNSIENSYETELPR